MLVISTTSCFISIGINECCLLAFTRNQNFSGFAVTSSDILETSFKYLRLTNSFVWAIISGKELCVFIWKLFPDTPCAFFFFSFKAKRISVSNQGENFLELTGFLGSKSSIIAKWHQSRDKPFVLPSSSKNHGKTFRTCRILSQSVFRNSLINCSRGRGV